MKTITELFDTSLKRQYKQKWKKLYVGIDIHGTILKPSWNKDDLGFCSKSTN